MATWRPNTVEEIRDWFDGRYVLNPTDEEYWKQLREQIRKLTPTTTKEK